jgi:uncharacterized protein YbjT (DUF2867 family)
MNVFVAGATGVLGCRVVPQLVEAEYYVTAVGRSEAKRGQLARAGARPIELELFDAAAVQRGVADQDVVINLTTSIPKLSRTFLPVSFPPRCADHALLSIDCRSRPISRSV